MKRSRRQAIQFVISLALAVGFGWLAFRGQDLEELSLTLGRTRWGYVALALVLTFLGHWARAARWRLLLAGAGAQVRTRDAFLSLLNGYFVNLGVPRLGELTRCGVLNRLSAAPLLGIAGTVVAERAVDLAVLGLISLVFFASAGEELDRLYQMLILDPVFLESGWNSKLVLLVALGLVGIAGLILLYFLGKSGKNQHGDGFRDRVASWARQLWQGLLSALRLRQRGSFLLLTLAIWVSYYSAPLLSLYALGMAGEQVLQIAFAAFLFGSLARTVPLPAGSMGAYHFMVSQVLLLWGYTEGEGLSLATLNHGVQTAFYLVAGLTSWAVLVWIQRNAMNSPKTMP